MNEDLSNCPLEDQIKKCYEDITKLLSSLFDGERPAKWDTLYHLASLMYYGADIIERLNEGE